MLNNTYNRYNFRDENGRYVLYYEDEVFKTSNERMVTTLSPYIAADVSSYLNFPDIPEYQGYPPSYYDKLIKPEDNSNIDQDSGMNMDVFRKLTKHVANILFSFHVTDQPFLIFVKENQCVFDAIFTESVTDPEMLVLRELPYNIYLKIVAKRAFSAGAYLTGKQLDYGRPYSKFTPTELKRVNTALRNKDIYDLSLKRLRISVVSTTYRILNSQIFDETRVTALKLVGSKIMEPQNIKAFMQVHYNAGISMFMVEKHATGNRYTI